MTPEQDRRIRAAAAIELEEVAHALRNLIIKENFILNGRLTLWVPNSDGKPGPYYLGSVDVNKSNNTVVPTVAGPGVEFGAYEHWLKNAEDRVP